VRPQPPEPVELGVEFRARLRIAVRQIDAGEDDAVDGGLDVAGLVVVAVALAIWGEASWYDWLLLSVGAAIAAVTPAPIPAVVGVVVIGWVCARAGGLTWRRPEPEPLSAG